jgi:toxin ParE1/3/4
LELLLGHLTIMPALGRPTSVAAVRVLVVPRYPYRIFYLAQRDAISILSVFHTARDPDSAPAD